MPDRVCAEITHAADRLVEIALERAAILIGDRLDRLCGFSDAALDPYLVSRGIK
ncbi:MAG: hypothetical protein WAN75_30855 [Xanthobacteraceae bacterium]